MLYLIELKLGNYIFFCNLVRYLTINKLTMRKIIFLLTILIAAISSNLTAQVEGFESTVVGSIPTDWGKYQSESDDSGFLVKNETGYAYQGNNYLAHEGVDLNAVSTSWIVSKAYHVGSAYELSFYWRGRWSSAYNFTAVYISTGSNDPVANPSDFTELKEFSPANYPNNWLQWKEEQYDLSAYANQDIYVAFKYVGDHAHDFYLDEFNVAAMPFCDNPDTIEITNRGTDFLDVSWSAVTGVENYEISWGPSGFDPDASGANVQTVNGATNFHLDGLTAGTVYDVYVRSQCSSFNYSYWTGPVTNATVGPAPANDICSGAINLDVYPLNGGTGHELQQNTFNTTDSGVHSSCDDIGTNLDLWYTVTVPTGETGFTIITSGDKGDNIEAAIYDSCGGNEIECFASGNSKTVRNLTAGQTYYVQVWLDDFNSGIFDIVIEKLPPTPANDDCDGAIALTVNTDNTCTTVTHSSNLNATPSSQPDDVTGTPNNDVWFSFVATDTRHEISLLNITPITGTSTDMGMGIYDGTNGCSNLTLVQDSDPESMIAYGLTIGTTYYIRVYGWYDNTNAQEFDICVKTIPPPPANDLCNNAINLTVYDINASIGNETPADTEYANDSGNHPSCDDTGINLDLWYTFTVPAGETMVTVKTGGDKGDKIEAALYDSCGGNEIDCQNNSSTKIFSGLTAGNTYILQVWHDNFNAGEFNIAIEKTPNAPINDICSGAVVLPVTNSCSPMSVSNLNTTDSGVPSPSCGYYQGGDLWFSVTIPSSGSVSVETSQIANSAVSDTGMAAYEGDCSNLTLLECNDDIDYPNNTFSQIQLTGRTPGEIVYFRIWEYGNDSFGDIGICAHDSSVSLAENTIEGLKFYPNPIQNVLNIEAQKTIQTVKIYSISGQEVLSLKPNTNRQQIDMSHLSNGIYFVKVQVNKQLTAFKVVKK